MHKFTLALILALSPLPCAYAQVVAPDAKSQLWGADGENWRPDSRLPFFGLSGYRSGREPIPDVSVVASVREFGAKGDGVTDDTDAIKRAVAAIKKGALLFPEGRYVLTDIINISKSEVVLRGEGPKKTVFVVPSSLEELRGKRVAAGAKDDNKSSYAFGGAFIMVRGADNGKKIADVVGEAKRGERVLTLNQDAAKIGIKAGDWVRLQMSDEGRTLGRYLHADKQDAGANTYQWRAGKPWVDWAARVEAADGANITLDRPLRLDVRLGWKPQILSSLPTVSDVGIEHLGFEFAGVPKKEHLEEEGFNAIHILRAVNCWVRDVEFTDADNALNVADSRFCTFSNLRIRAAKRTGLTGHHGLWATGGAQDCLFTDFQFETRYVHDLAVEGLANGNVFSDGLGPSLNFDHHRNAPYENLFSNINAGDGKRLWDSGGRNDRGPNSAARATFWNIRAPQGKIPPVPDWPQINAIGVQNQTPDMTPDGAWIEPLADAATPPDLYQAQRARGVAAVE